MLGQVTFKGNVPDRAKIDNSICKHAEPIVDESVLVDKDGGLANVIVWVAGVKTPVKAPETSPVLDQMNCRFAPHVVVVRAGESLMIRNSDDEPHNVHATPSNNPAFNVALPTKRSEKPLVLGSPDIFRARCDVHPWMIGYIGVFECDYVAVTAENGSFKISGLPSGSYELRAWHERFGELKQTIEVKSDSVLANFAYEPK